MAIKKILKPFSTPVLAKRTYRELRLLKQLQHENLISLRDIFISPLEDIYFVTELLGSCGIVVPCSEAQLDAIGCVSGTGPAYVMLFLEAMADAAVKLGIPRDTALRISAQTIYGSGKLAIETGLHPAVLKDQVCSPGGTTIEGVLTLEKFGLRAAVEAAVEAADEKTKRLAGG